MGVVIIGVVTEEAHKKHTSDPNFKPEPDVTFIPVYDPSKVIETIKAQPETPTVVLVTNSFEESVQKEVEAAVKANVPGLHVTIIPQGIPPEKVKEFLDGEKAKHYKP